MSIVEINKKKYIKKIHVDTHAFTLRRCVPLLIIFTCNRQKTIRVTLILCISQTRRRGNNYNYCSLCLAQLLTVVIKMEIIYNIQYDSKCHVIGS